ncbi:MULTISPECIES: shikimate dehydrogenase [Acidobacterium]|nr:MULTISPECIES: shikimate dehydrogenase [Acidobacterium]HCT62271.1 shikimate dehydrogenase [Acidobacterium sp.]
MTDRIAVSSLDPGTGASPAAAVQLLRSRISRVCVAIAASSPDELIEKAREAARENPFLEFRLDYLPNPAAAISRIQQFLYELGEVTAIATCRREPNGGKFKGSIEAEIQILEKAIAAGCDLIDIEIETAEKLKAAELARIRSLGAALIISYHDFKATRDLDRMFEKIQRYSPDFVKMVSTATCLADNLAMMHFLERSSDAANVVGICMGEQGLISRVLGVRAGSVFTFASAQAGEETGPGQIAARTLHEIFRIDQVSPATRVYGVVGNPVMHSLSPLIHNLAFRRETVNAVFLPLQANTLSDVLRLVKEVPLHGLAVTMPFKGEILKHLTNTDALSEKIGACNTVVRALDGNLYGFNTDVAAVVRPLERRLPLRDARVLVIGAGGAARAAVFGLKDKGADVTIVNRTPETAQKLARQAKARTIRYEQLAKASFDVILNATPIGMHGHKQQSWLKPDQLNARLVFDMVYNPIETPLLRMAREKGLPVITGVEMFVQQGARQFEIWTGKPAPEDEMLRAVVHALRRRSGEQENHSLADSIAPARRLTIPAAKPEAAAETTAEAKTEAAGTSAKAAPKPVQKKTAAAPVAAKAAKTPAAVVKPAAKAVKSSKPEKQAVPVKQAVPAKQAAPAKQPTSSAGESGHGTAKPAAKTVAVAGKKTPPKGAPAKSPAKSAAKAVAKAAPKKAAAKPTAKAAKKAAKPQTSKPKAGTAGKAAPKPVHKKAAKPAAKPTAAGKKPAPAKPTAAGKKTAKAAGKRR